MREGISLADLAAELRRQADSKEDFILDTRHLELVDPGAGPELSIAGHGVLPVRLNAHRQMGDRLKIPATYYDRLLGEAPDLLLQNVNYWFQRIPEIRMVRTLDREVRAYLSDRYRPLEHYDLAEVVLPALADAGAAVHSCHVTPTRLYIKGVMEAVEETVPPPKGAAGRSYHAVTMSPGIVISNSEVGRGALSIQPAVHNLQCTNMAVWAEHALRRLHLGPSLGADSDEVMRYLSDETRRLSDAALWSQVRDIVRRTLQGEVFAQIVGDLQAARAAPLPAAKAPEAVKKLAQRHGLGDRERTGVLGYLIEGGDLTRFGLSNAVTRYSQDVEDYDRASWLEELGGEVIALPPNDWGALVN